MKSSLHLISAERSRRHVRATLYAANLLIVKWVNSDQQWQRCECAGYLQYMCISVTVIWLCQVRL